MSFSIFKNLFPIDVEARTLIVRMLTVNQKQRITAEQALDSKWLQEYDRRNKSHRPKTIQKIKQFNAKRKFKGGVMAVMAANKMDNLIRGINHAAKQNNESDPGSPNNKNSVGAAAVGSENTIIPSNNANNKNNNLISANNMAGDSGIGSSTNNQHSNNQGSSYQSAAGDHNRSPESRSKASSKSPGTSRSSKDKKKKKWYQIF